jgi:hypothetical protein
LLHALGINKKLLGQPFFGRVQVVSLYREPAWHLIDNFPVRPVGRADRRVECLNEVCFVEFCLNRAKFCQANFRLPERRVLPAAAAR